MRIAYTARLPPKELVSIRLVKSIVTRENPDLMVLGGDRTPDPSALARVLGIHEGSDKSGTALVIVSGDEDDVLVTKRARASGLLYDGDILTVKDVTLAFIGGLEPVQNTERLLGKLERMNMNGNAVLVTHYPPKGCWMISTVSSVVDIGLTEVSDAALKLRPTVIICTHAPFNSVSITPHELKVIGLSSSELGAYLVVDIDDKGITSSFKVLNLLSH